MGKVTATKFAGNPGNAPDVFLGGYEAGVSIPMPTDMTDVQNLALSGNGGHPTSGGDAWNTTSMYNDVLWLEFQSDGSVIRYVGEPKGTAAVDTVSVTDIAPDGVLWGTEDIHVEGTVNGDLTVYSDGDVIIDDDLVYADNPLTNSASDDMIGLIAEDEVFIDYSGPPKDEYILHCSAYAIGGSFRIEKLDANASDFTFRVLGSLAMAVGKQAGEGRFPAFNLIRYSTTIHGLKGMRRQRFRAWTTCISSPGGNSRSTSNQTQMAFCIDGKSAWETPGRLMARSRPFSFSSPANSCFSYVPSTRWSAVRPFAG